MFGTLNVLPEVPLTFVENPDLASALSRSRRDKPHVSCKLCRLRKIRCSGDPLGCDKCVAISAECQYPARDTRRKKRVNTISSHESNTNNNAPSTSSSDQVTSYQRQGAGGGDGSSSGGGGGTEGGRFSNHDRVSSNPASMDHDMDSGAIGPGQPCSSEHQPWGYSESAGDAGSPSPARAGIAMFDEWQDLSPFLHPMPGGPPDPLGEGGKDVLADRLMNDSTFHSDDRFNVYAESEGFDQTSSNDFPSPGGGLPPSWVVSGDSNTESNSSRSRKSNHVRHESYSRGFGSGQSGWSDKGHGGLGTRVTSRNTPRIPSPPSALRKLHSKESAATTSTSNGTSPGDICRCLYLAARLLEDLGAKSAQSNPTTIDVLLGVFRDALRQVTAILGCQKCLSRTENNMLLAMAGRYMSLICDQLVGVYVRLQEARGRESLGEQDLYGWGSGSSSGPGSLPRSPSSSTSSGAWQEAGRGVAGFEANSRAASGGRMSSAEGADEMWFSTYRIESSRERLQVLNTLVTVQMTEFSQVLEKLKTRAGRQRGQMELLIEAEKRAQAARNRLHANSGFTGMGID
ncbi:hypothetical protein DL763_001626 [Monosporascus cannonballus]|nr:hypothetical protein DL763_001626 [Monosporascus cannonballus]